MTTDDLVFLDPRAEFQMSYLYPGAAEFTKDSVYKLVEKYDYERLFSAVVAYLDICGCWGPVDEWNSNVERFYNLFLGNQVHLNEGVRSLDYVRECVRRSFNISEVVEFGCGNRRRSWQSPDKISKIATRLVDAGFVLSPNHNRGL